MLKIYKEVSVYIESDNVDLIYEKLNTFCELENCVVVTSTTVFNGTKYSRIPMFLSKTKFDELCTYLNEEYEGTAIIIDA